MTKERKIEILRKIEKAFSQPPRVNFLNSHGICCYLSIRFNLDEFEQKEILNIIPNERKFHSLSYTFGNIKSLTVGVNAQGRLWHTKKYKFARRNWARRAIKYLEV